MKSIMTLCTAIAFVVLGTAASLAVYEKDVGIGRNMSIQLQPSGILDSFSSIPTKQEASVSTSPTDQVINQEDNAIMAEPLTHTVKVMFLNAQENSPKRAFQPTLILLFGLGLIGIARFTRKVFKL